MHVFYFNEQHWLLLLIDSFCQSLQLEVLHSQVIYLTYHCSLLSLEMLELCSRIFIEKHTLPSDRRHLSCDDCLEDKSEDYQNCSVLYCVPQLYTKLAFLTGVQGLVSSRFS